MALLNLGMNCHCVDAWCGYSTRRAAPWECRVRNEVKRRRAAAQGRVESRQMLRSALLHSA
ncbi:hypothetical protein [Fischerella sp. PCC 9605]|uniref:hypothetical protein n=1 Tax=Fischerella sp. PCC 9605 TaxID=1173024 RepID=UPI001E29A259|nr:hypothetical protein [Fischerella sp. PCC 9605]